LLNLNGFVGWDLFLNGDLIFSDAPFGTVREPKGSEADRLLNDFDQFYVWAKKT